MPKKKSKKSVRRSVSASAPSTAGPNVDHYARSAAAFDALILAFVEAEAVQRVARELGKAIEEVQKLGETPNYISRAEPDDPPDLRESIERRRAQQPPRLKRMVGLADTYFATERRFRSAVETAKVAVDRAAWELDSPETPPLKRTSIAIRRALRNLSGSVPYAMTAGWAEATEPKVLDGIDYTARRVSVWIEELRLLVRPRHTLPPPLSLRRESAGPPLELSPTAELRAAPEVQSPHVDKKPRRRATPQESRDERRAVLATEGKLSELQEFLTDLQIEFLGALEKVGAFDSESRRSADFVAQHAMHNRDPKSITHVRRDLIAMELVRTHGGSAGGAWITSKGLGVLQARRTARAGARVVPEKSALSPT